MSLKEIFRAELDFLKKDGKYFSKIYPHLSRFLSDEIVDPEAERIIESFAFLTARLKEKIQDDFPELTQSMIQLLWPNYLRPLPSSAILHFEPKERAITTKHVIPKNTLVYSKPVDGTSCRFKTTMNVAVYPLILRSVRTNVTPKSSVIELQLENISEGDFSSLQCDELSIYLSGSDYNALTCYQWLFNYLDKISVQVDENEILLPLDCISSQGLEYEDYLLPYPSNAFDGYRLIQEFFFFPKKFYFFKLRNLHLYLRNVIAHDMKFIFRFNRPLPKDLNLGDSDFSLYCTPVINLFPHDAIPINLDGKKTAYPVIPAGLNRSHFEIFDIKHVTRTKLTKYAGQESRIYEYPRFESFSHDVVGTQEPVFYKATMKENLEENGYEHYISFVSRKDEVQEQSRESISIDLECTNSNLPEYLGIGDICIPSQDTPSYIDFRNITRPCETVRPALQGALHWQLISNLSLSYASLSNLDVLKEVLLAYDFNAIYDLQSERRTKRRLDAIQRIDTIAVDRIIKGIAYRGSQSSIEIDGDKFLCEGEVFLFGTVLAEFFRLYGTINSFHELKVINISNNEIFKWDRKTSLQRMI